MQPYRVSVAPILEDLGTEVSLDGVWELDHFNVGDEIFSLTGPAQVSGEVTNAGTGLVATGIVRAVVHATCARCLCDFEMTISADIEGFYVEAGHETGLPEEQEIEFISPDQTIDVAPALHAALVLEAPFAPLHDPECAGICPTCGTDLNAGICGCTRETADDHPFAALKDLRLSDESDDGAAED